MEKKIKFQITSEQDGLMIKAILSKHLNLSRREISRLKFNHGIVVNGESVRVTEIMHEGDTVEIIFLEQDEKKAQIIENKPEILYEDEDLVIVNKPTGMPTHPSHKHLHDDMGTLLQNYYQKKFVVRAIGRLDKDVSGVVLYAKNQPSASRLSTQRNTGILQKTYIAIIHGKVKKKKDTLVYGIHKQENSILKSVNPNEKDCITHYEVLKENDDYTILKVIIETGRSHQIRAGLAYFLQPIVGDALYGKKEDIPCCLHCASITLQQPFQKERIVVEAPLPTYMQKFYTK